jgi:sec-independent protein translocase protein TatA
MPVGLHLPELLILLVVAILIFGPKKLPEIGATVGKSITAFKKGMRELHEENEKEENREQNLQSLLKQRQSELEALEQELASKKASVSAYEAAQTVHAEASTTNSKPA